MTGDDRALREASVFVDLAHRGKIDVSGADRVTFLQGMLTNDVKRLSPGKGLYAALLTRVGKIVADMNVYCDESRLVLDLDVQALSIVSATLEKHVITEDVRIADSTVENRALALFGPASRRVVVEAFGEDAPPAGPLDHRRAEAAGIRVRIVRSAAVPPIDGFELWSATEASRDLASFLLDRGAPVGLVPADPEALETARIEAGMPRLGVDMGPDHNPIEAGIARAINATKGCYLGQEVVSKATRAGHVSRRLVGLRIEGMRAPAPGAAVLSNGEEAGRVTSAAVSPALGAPIALAYVAHGLATPGTAVAVALSSGIAPARVCALPFVRPGAVGDGSPR